MFAVGSSDPPPASIQSSLLKEDDPVWARLVPLELSPALSYQWTESLANRNLLAALNIDSRNIVSTIYVIIIRNVFIKIKMSFNTR